MKKYYNLSFLLFLISNASVAEIIDPEEFIKKNGYQATSVGDNGKRYYKYTDRTQSAERIIDMVKEVATLPKDKPLFEICEYIRSSLNAELIKADRKMDVSIYSYGYSGSIMTCVNKLTGGGFVGVQLIFIKDKKLENYKLIITD